MERRKTARLLTAVLAVVGAGVLVMGATASSTKPTIRSANNASLGTILVGATGLTVYHYADDHGKVVACNGACAKLWPPVVIAASAKPVAGPGLTASKLGTVKRPDGTMQVTYNGYALYRFSGDKHAGDVNGQGLEKAWYAVAPSGHVVKLSPSASTSASTSAPSDASSSSSSSSSSSTPSGSSTGGGGDYGYGY
jgi:predicted lipoprotein with Yx(FWY)xxD motif